jgi:NifU-like protein involved in Fe-S cluster formation/bacterioferritin-associated ferredoxin
MRPILIEERISPYVGEVRNPQGEGRAGSLVCGAFLRVTLRIDDVGRITRIRFKVAGCSRLVAACGAMSQAVEGLRTADAALLAQSLEATATRNLGPPPAGREHCASLAGEALLTAVRSYSDASRTEWQGEDALICSCFGVCERTIEEAVHRHGMSAIEDVTKACRAGAGCRSCYPLIQDILDGYRS